MFWVVVLMWSGIEIRKYSFKMGHGVLRDLTGDWFGKGTTWQGNKVEGLFCLLFL